MLKPANQPYSAIAARAALWLAFLAPFFYATYGGANWLAAQRADVPYIVLWWERWTPFLPWTILPYWSINLFYAASLFINDSKSGVNRLAGRYLTAQIVAVVCFIAFPLIAIYQRPETSGLPGLLFDILGGFDKPYNQAPSLHIALLVIIWDHLRYRLRSVWLAAWHVWCLLIGVSVLTTWQHQFIDIPTGALLGLVALWLFPRKCALPLGNFRFARNTNSLRLGLYYGAGFAACFAGAWVGASAAPLWLGLLWPAIALGVVALGYFGAGPDVFQKDFEGNLSFASRILLWPYRLFARLNAWAWTRHLPPAVEIAKGSDKSKAVFLGRFPSADEANSYNVVVDLAAELPRPRGSATIWQSVPMLDLVPPSDIERDLAAFIVDAYHDKTVLICCALGFQRSASVAASWLMRSGHAANLAEAQTILAASGRPVHLHKAHDEAHDGTTA